MKTLKEANMKILLPIGAAVMAMVVAMPLHAGGSWFSKVREIPAETSGDGGSPERNEVRALGVDSTQSVFDIVVSLESNPTGDDDATQDSGTGDDAQNLFEDVIKKFADGVCQQTNTAHKLGVVRIFRNFDEDNRAEVKYKTDCERDMGPRANPSGFGVDGKLIYMCERWADAGSFDPLIENAEASGFTLAHEWGHYAYGLFDEHAGSGRSRWQPMRGDTPSNPSIMHNHWCAVSSPSASGCSNPPDPNFLEFSTSRVAPFDGSGGTNAQLRMYGKSGWDTLVANTKDDPKLRLFLPRVRYTNLDAVKPTASRPVDGSYTWNNDESDCRSELDIQWVGGGSLPGGSPPGGSPPGSSPPGGSPPGGSPPGGSPPALEIVVDILIDRSGSMRGTPIANAKAATDVSINLQPEGQSAIGISSFAGGVTDDFPITKIPNPDTRIKDQAKAAVSRISAFGSTALFDGLLSSLDKLTGFSDPSLRKVVVVLSDGNDNDSYATQSEVTTAYRNASVPIFAIGFGDGTHNSVLSALARGTGGEFHFSPTNLQEFLQGAFLVANAGASGQAVVVNAPVPISTSQTETTVTVDDTLSSLQLVLSYPGAVDDVTLALLDPSGQDTGVTFSCAAPGATVTCLGSLATIAAHGDYRLRITNAVTKDIDVSLIVTGRPITGETYDVAVSINDGEDVTYPEPMVITATVRHETAIAGLVVSAEVLDSSGSRIETIDLLDDGQDVDAVQDDGTYTGVFDYTESGQFTVRVHVDNSAMTGMTTTLGELAATLPDGSAQDPMAARRPIGTAFTRSDSVSVNVVGVLPDDHLDSPPGCTAIDADNSDVSGQIDHPGDVDCFRFTPSEVTSDLMVRSTGQIAGMDSVVTVLASDGTTVIKDGDASTSENPESGVVVRVPATDIDPSGMVVTVKHRDATADQGSYAVSAGTAISSDTPPPVPGQPTELGATAGDARAMLAWTAPPGNATITGWQYRYKAGNADYGSWTDVPGSDAGTTSHTVTGLDNGTRYTFQVRAVNASGPGPASDEASTTPTAPPTAPTRSGGGSAVGPWTLGLAALLGIVGLFARRGRRA